MQCKDDESLLRCQSRHSARPASLWLAHGCRTGSAAACMDTASLRSGRAGPQSGLQQLAHDIWTRTGAACVCAESPLAGAGWKHAGEQWTSGKGKGKETATILHRLHFSSSLKRMAAVVKVSQLKSSLLSGKVSQAESVICHTRPGVDRGRPSPGAFFSHPAASWKSYSHTQF